MPTPPTPDPATPDPSAADPAATGDHPDLSTTSPSATGEQDSSTRSSSEDDLVEDEGKGGNAEAARYRRQLRDTQGERDALAGRVERLQHAEVSRIVSDRLAVPGDVFAFGLSLGDVLDDDGDVEPGLVETAVFGLLASRPGLAKAAEPAPVSLGQGNRQSASVPSWADVLRDT
jgi:hypothetical protein